MPLKKEYKIPKPKKAADTKKKPNTFILIGPARAGKTTQFLTMPKPAAALILDPNGTEGIRGGSGIDYWEFPIDTVSLAPKTGKARPMEEKELDTEPQAYMEFWRFLRTAKETKLFQNYASVMLDGITSLEKIAEDIVMHDLGLTADIIGKDQSGNLRGTIQNVLREMTSIFLHASMDGKWPLNLLVTAHQADRVDRSGAVIGSTINAFGKLRQFIPSLFAHVFYVSQERVEGETRYYAKTRGDDMIKDAGTAFRGLPYKVDMTVEDWSNPEEYGLGRIIRLIEEEGEWYDDKPVRSKGVGVVRSLGPTRKDDDETPPPKAEKPQVAAKSRVKTK